MKRQLISVIVILCALGLYSCGVQNNGGKDTHEPVKVYTDGGFLDKAVQNISEFEECDFTAQYIRTDGYHDDVHYPAVKIIRSAKELNDYYQANKDKYNLERRTTVYSDSTVGFLDACDKYTDEYFEDRILLMILIEEGSGSIRHKVERVGTDANGIAVEINTIVPEAGTCDMAEWHILVEIQRDADVLSEDDVTVLLDGRDATEKITEVYYEKGYANISLTLKEGWEYDIADEPDTQEFSVNIYPQGQPKNNLRIAYFNGFGVCGTGLKQEKIKLGRYDAWMGTYDNNKVWNFISILDTFGDYVILNEGAEEWWDEYGNEAMQILATLKVADGYISEAGAVQIAKDKADSDDEEPQVQFDYEKSAWSVTLSGNNTTDDDTFVIDIYGNIIDIIE